MFDPTRLVRTRCRYEVRIYATDGGGLRVWRIA